MKKLAITLGIITSLFVGSTNASNKDIKKTFVKLGYPETTIQISDVQIKNLKSVLTPDGIFYSTDDGKFITQGTIYNVSGSNAENIANSIHKKIIETIKDDAIVFKAKNEKYAVSVFTDYTCTYCKKLHESIDDYLNAGISIHYYAFPRSGPDSQVGINMQSIWSSKDRKTAFNNAYKGGDISPISSMIPYINRQFNAGRQLGISGTPAIILPNGQMISGYVPADELLKLLDKLAK